MNKLVIKSLVIPGFVSTRNGLLLSERERIWTAYLPSGTQCPLNARVHAAEFGPLYRLVNSASRCFDTKGEFNIELIGLIKYMDDDPLLYGRKAEWIKFID